MINSLSKTDDFIKMINSLSKTDDFMKNDTPNPKNTEQILKQINV